MLVLSGFHCSCGTNMQQLIVSALLPCILGTQARLYASFCRCLLDSLRQCTKASVPCLLLLAGEEPGGDWGEQGDDEVQLPVARAQSVIHTQLAYRGWQVGGLVAICVVGGPCAALLAVTTTTRHALLKSVDLVHGPWGNLSSCWVQRWAPTTFSSAESDAALRSRHVLLWSCHLVLFV